MRTFRALIALSALCLGSSAQAQIFFDGYAERWSEPVDRYERFRDTRPLDGREIRDQLVDDGFQVLSLRPDRGDWIADVRDPSGRRMRLIVDGYDGRILRRVENSAPPQTRTPPRAQTTPRAAPAPAPTQTAPAPTAPPPSAPAVTEPAPQPQVQSAPAPPSQPPRVIPLYNKPE